MRLAPAIHWGNVSRLRLVCRVRSAFSTEAAEGMERSGTDAGTANNSSSAAADALVTAPGLLLLVPLMLGLNGKVWGVPVLSYFGMLGQALALM